MTRATQFASYIYSMVHIECHENRIIRSRKNIFFLVSRRNGLDKYCTLFDIWHTYIFLDERTIFVEEHFYAYYYLHFIALFFFFIKTCLEINYIIYI